MKKLILCAGIFLGMTGLASAQTTGGQGSRSTQQVSNQSKKKAKKKGTTTTAVNQRRMHPSKKTGQTATPTGQEATGTGSSNANNPKNAGKNDE